RDNITVADIFLEQGQIQIMNSIGRECYSRSENSPSSFFLSKFTVSSTKNKFTAVGCDTSAIVRGFTDSNTRYSSGCLSICDGNYSVAEGSCSGTGCCPTSIPKGLLSLNVTVSSYSNNRNVTQFSLCGFAFVVEESKFNFSSSSFQGLRTTDKKIPLVLDWTIGDRTCEMAQTNMTQDGVKIFVYLELS
ncbi:unnamed protein product, partial [Ilex paraguariensis]